MKMYRTQNKNSDTAMAGQLDTLLTRVVDIGHALLL